MHDVLDSGAFPAAATRGADFLARAWRNTFPFIVVGALWEAVAHLGVFPAQFFPPLETIAAAFARLTASGALPHHALDTLGRLIAGFALAACAGVIAGVLILAIGFSRVFLSVHYLSDVIAGFLVGAFWVFIAQWLGKGAGRGR